MVSFHSRPRVSIRPACLRRSAVMVFIVCMCVAALLGVVVTHASAQSPFKQLPPAALNQAQKDKAEKFALTTLTAWRTGKFEIGSGELTPELKTASTPEANERAYRGIKELFGDFESLEFVEAVTSPNLPQYVLYRCKGKFTKSSDRPEIRVVFNKQGQVAGFWIKPWRDQVL